MRLREFAKLDEIKKGAKDSNGFSSCWTGYHAAGTKKGKNGGPVRNCVKNESLGANTHSSLEADLAKKYMELAPSIKKYKDEEGADHLYRELLAIARHHGAERKFIHMCNGARNSAHMDYDTNPGHFKNWFWYLGLGNEQGVAEGLPQTLRKVVPGYAKREIDKKMDDQKFGKTDVDKDANYYRYKKIQDKIKEQGVAEGWDPEDDAAEPLAKYFADLYYGDFSVTMKIKLAAHIYQSIQNGELSIEQLKADIDMLEKEKGIKEQGVAEGNLNELFEPTLNYYKLSNGKTVQVSYRPNVNQSPVPFTDVSVSYVNTALKPQGPSFDSTGVAKPWTSAPDGVKQAIQKFATQPQQGVAEGLKTKIEHLQRQLLEAKLAISLAKKTPL